MALIDILNRKKNSFYPVSEEELHEEAIKTPDIADMRASDHDNMQPSEIVQPQQNTATIPDNKWGYSQSEMEWLSKHGYTPERLEYYNADFDPSKGENFLQRIYEASVSKPNQPDEKQIRNAKLAGTIADSLGLLSQMWSYGRGAHVKERDNKNSATSQIAEQERNLRNIYLQQQNKYNDGLYNARMRDLVRVLEDYNNGKKGIQGVLAAKQKADEAIANQQYSYFKLAQDQANKDRDYEIKIKNNESLDRHRKTLQAQGWARVADSKDRTSAYIKRNASGSSKNDYQIIFEASPNDKEALTDNQFGEKVRVFTLTKGEIDRYAREAISDTAFMNRHQELILQRPDMLGSGSLKYKPNTDIAAAYLKEQYESRYPYFTPVQQSVPQTVSPASTDEEEEDEWGEFAID